MKTTFILSLLIGTFAQAATLPVTTTADTGVESLRAQIAAAVSGDTIAIFATGTIALTTGEIAIVGKNLSLVGPGAGSLTITTNATTRALRIANAQVSISGLTFNNCKALAGDVDTGGAVCVDNFTAGGTSNVTSIADCAFTNNQSGWGGALDVFNGGLTMSGCTFAGNTCNGMAFGTTGGGGALSIGPSRASSITNCTFSANTQSGIATGQPGGGAIYNYGVGTGTPPVVTVEHCTFVANVDSAGAAGAIKGNYNGSYKTSAALKNCLLVNNQAPGTTLKNFSGSDTGPLTTAYTSLGGNVTDEAATSTQIMSTAVQDKPNTATLASSIAPTLALNGGVVKTHAITRGSPAQRSAQASTVTTDQRGAPRHAQADAGAFELIEPEIGLALGVDAMAEADVLDFASTPFDHPITKTITITNTQTSAFTTGTLTLGSAAAGTGYTLTGFPSVTLDNGQSATFDVTLAANTPGLFATTLTFSGNDRFNSALATGGTNQHRINLSGLVTDTIDHWRQQQFGPTAANTGNAADDAAPAGDGISNLLKYSLGLNPTQPYAPGTGTASSLDPMGCLSMTINKNPTATDVQLLIEVSSDLGQETSWSAAETVTDQNTPTVLKAHDSKTVNDAPRRFMRLRAVRP